MSKLILKKGREKPVRQRHPWIFSGSVAKGPTKGEGAIVAVVTSEGELLGHAFFNEVSKSLSARMVSFGDVDPLEAIKRGIVGAIEVRRRLIAPQTTGYRLINSEGDSLPGLIVDVYGPHLVIQISTLGMERIKPFIIQCLKEALRPESIYERSESASRKEEGMKQPQVGQLFGVTPQEIIMSENGIQFTVSVQDGQKTGFFFDQRERRAQIGALSKGKRVLNLFSYTGGFSIYALRGGALSVKSVDTSKKALSLIDRHIELNGLDPAKHASIEADVFSYIRQIPSLDEDIIILDPPALVKRPFDLVAGARAYKDLNREVMKRMKPGSLLLTCSCSYPVDEKLFQQILFQSADEAVKDVRILSKHLLALDHPLNIYHPEGGYLKSMLLYIQ